MKKISTTKQQKNSNDKLIDNLSDRQTRQLAEQMERLMPYAPDTTRFTVLCHRSDYSAGTIARAIEDCNAHVLNLNLTADSLSDDRVAVDIRVDRNNISSIIRSLARFNFTVVGEDTPDVIIDDTDRERIAQLLRLIDI